MRISDVSGACLLGGVGIALASDVKQNVFNAAREYRTMTAGLRVAMSVVAIALSLILRLAFAESAPTEG